MASATLSSIASSTATSSASPTCIFVTPDSNGYVPEYACDSNYNYYPSFSAAVLFAVLFGITFIAHVTQAILYRKLRLTWPLLMGAAWEFASFAVRSAGTKNQQSLSLAFVSQILVLLAPLWLNAFAYMVLGRMIYFFLPEQKIFGIHARRIALWFVCFDILSFLTQVGGGLLINPGNDPNTLLIGIHVYMGGVGIQEFFIVVFMAFALRFRTLMRRFETGQLPAVGLIDEHRKQSWRGLLYVLLACLALITTRIIYRLVEFASGINPDANPIPYHEWYFYAFDALPMFVAFSVMNAVHPGRVLVGPESEFPRMSRKEKKVAKAEKKERKAKEKEEKKAAKEERKRKNQEWAWTGLESGRGSISATEMV